MITRFYVDNYKCLQNFEYKPQKLELIVGVNGTGKSTVFEALDKVRRFVTGEADARELFPRDCGTRWSSRAEQIFELDYSMNDTEFQYRLELNLPSRSSSYYRIEKEILKMDGKIIYETTWKPKGDSISRNNYGYLTPFDNHAEEVLILNWSREGRLSLVDPNQSAFKLASSFAQDLTQVHVLKINPAVMTSQVKKAEPRPANDLSNFASYCLYLLQRQGRMFTMMEHLRSSIKDFNSFSIEEDFEAGRRNLQVVCQQPNAKGATAKAIKFSLEEMSDGQRALIALYTLLICTLEPDSTLIIDEPENYVALRELQPWLMLLQDILDEYGGQVILISHHPEFINALAPGNTTVFEREDNGPVRTKPFDGKMLATLSPAEIMARGWENE